MIYEEWLELIKRLEKTSHKEDIEKLKNEEYNENINQLLVPKIKDMIVEKFNKNVNTIIENLEFIFSDENELDLALVTFKKNISVILSLIKNKQLNIEQQEDLKNNIINGTESIYETLYEAAFDASDDGIYNSIINRNRIKWSDENELSGN